MTTAQDIIRLREQFRDRRRVHECDLDYQLAKLKKKVVKRADKLVPSDIETLNETLGRWFNAFGLGCLWALIGCLGIEGIVQGIRFAKWMAR